MDFKLWRADDEGKYSVIKEPDLGDSFKLNNGVPRLAAMASPARCEMDSDYPDQIQLADNLYGSSMVVISRRLRKVLESTIKDGIEYLPIRLINHKGRPESSEYFVLHPLDVIDCIDPKASKVKWNALNRDLIQGCKSLILNPKAIPSKAKLFRLKHWGYNIVVRQDIIDALQKAHLTGLSFLPPKEYTGIE